MIFLLEKKTYNKRALVQPEMNYSEEIHKSL